jgi:hypothetical protein
MRKILQAGVFATAFYFANGAIACETPSIVNVPNGAQASMDQMVAAQKQVKDYVAAMEDYLACVNDELETAGEDAPDEYKSLMINRHNMAVGEMEAVAAAFNEQVKAYKAAHPE